MNIYFGFGIIGLILLALHIREHLDLREFRDSLRHVNPEHLEYLQRGGK
ncbi:MAG TPA: hypothetical protein VHO03_17215 [Ignavibacteriales bacterium]|nr:hypothetical protein [Ignavibacteriales bacterium]